MTVSAATQASAQTKTGSSIITVKNCNKTFKSGAVGLKDFELEVNAGELFGLVGPDGAGKTTAIEILAGLTNASSGNIQVLSSQPHKIRHMLGYVPQDLALYPELTVIENLEYASGLYQIKAKKAKEQSDKFLAKFHLTDFKNRQAAKLSGGMKQNLALCMALVGSPALLLLDEPTTGLDPIARINLWQTLLELSAAGTTILVATPFLDEAERCSKVGLIYEGKIQVIGSPEELKKQSGLTRLLLVSEDREKLGQLQDQLKTEAHHKINSIQSFGDSLEILVSQSDTAELSKLIEQLGQHGQVKQTEATMENVFVNKLQKLGLSEKPIEALEIKNRTAPNKNQNAIEARGLNKSFGDFSAVKDVSVNIAYGEIYGLLGANGAGKTTTIKMLCGLLRPDSGTITLGGENSQLRSTNLRRKIGYMSQKFTLYDGLTVKENLEFYCGIYEIPVNDRQRRIQWAIKTADMAGKENRLVGQLPFGWKQRVAFVSALMHQPEILFLDEPTAGVDPVARRQLWAMIKKMAQDGTAVLVTTHYMDEAEYCNRLSFMSDSRLIVEGSPHEIRQKGKAIKSDDKGLDDSLDAAFIKLVGQARRAEGGNDADK